MSNPAPLLIVIGALATLWVIQQLLVRAGRMPSQQSATSSSVTTPRRGRPLFAELSVAGLDERGVERLRTLIRENDITALTTFLAFNRPSVVELDLYLMQVRTQVVAILPTNNSHPDIKSLCTTLKSYQPPTPPANIHLDVLSTDERYHALTFDPRTQRLITRELMARFGGHDFSKHFVLYCKRDKGAALHVPPFDPDRSTLETLAESDIAHKGRHIPLPLRLTVLKMEQLRQMATELKFDRKFNRKQEAVDALAKIPGAAVLLSMQYVVDDLFILNPLDANPADIKHEWIYLTAYAKLLTSAGARPTTPHELP
jgi:hypothetical protein